MKTSAIFFLVSFLLFSACQPPLLNDPELTAIVGSTIIDGTGDEPIENSIMLIKDGRINQIINSSDIRLGDSVKMVNANGAYVLPGFIDAHAHVINYRADLPIYLDYGITGVRAPVSLADTLVIVRDEVDAGDRLAPTIRLAGVFVCTRHTGEGWWDVADSPEEARDIAKKQIAKGVDFIKVYDDLDTSLIKVITEEAHAAGIKVIGHLGRTNWWQGVDSGVDALTHSWFSSLPSSLVPESQRSEFIEFHTNSNDFDPQVLRKWLPIVQQNEEIAHELGSYLAEAGTIIDPTLVLVEATLASDSLLWSRLVPGSDTLEYSPHPMSAEWIESLDQEAEQAFQHFLKVTKIFHDKGVIIAAGSDTPNPWMYPGVSFHRELELLAQSGISNLDIITIATKNGAMAMGMESEFGTVETGKRANFILLDRNPLEDISATQAIRSVYLNGEKVREGLQ